MSCRKTSSRVGPLSARSLTPDPFAAQLRGCVLDQLEAVSWGGHRQPVRTLVRLGIPTAHPGERLLSELALGHVRKLDLEDLTADSFLELVSRTRGDHPAVVDHRDPLGELIGLLQVLGGQEQRGAASLKVPDRSSRPVSPPFSSRSKFRSCSSSGTSNGGPSGRPSSRSRSSRTIQSPASPA